jgi:hypothetical protein
VGVALVVVSALTTAQAQETPRSVAFGQADFFGTAISVAKHCRLTTDWHSDFRDAVATATHRGHGEVRQEEIAEAITTRIKALDSGPPPSDPVVYCQAAVPFYDRFREVTRYQD